MLYIPDVPRVLISRTDQFARGVHSNYANLVGWCIKYERPHPLIENLGVPNERRNA